MTGHISSHHAKASTLVQVRHPSDCSVHISGPSHSRNIWSSGQKRGHDSFNKHKIGDYGLDGNPPILLPNIVEMLACASLC